MCKDIVKKIPFVALLIWLLIYQCHAQNPEIHQAAGITRFTGIYSFLGSYIAIREAYFLASLVCVLVAANVFLTFFQLPSFYLPIHHNQRRGFPGFLEQIFDLLTSTSYILRILEALERL